MSKYLKLGLIGGFCLLGGILWYLFAFGARSPAKVATIELQELPAQLVLAVVGRVRSQAFVDIRSERPGAIAAMMYDEGDLVAAGVVLASVQSDEERAGLSVSRAQLQALEAEVTLAQIKLNRTQTLADKGLLAPAALDEARASLETAKANRKAAQAAIAQAEARVGEYDVRAPMDGIILARLVDPGQVVGTTDIIFQIGSRGAIEIEAEVDEFYADELKVGMPALLAPSGSRDVYDGTLDEIAPRIDPLTGGRIVRLKPSSDNDAFLPGRSVDVNIIVDNIDRALSVPRGAIIRKDGEWRVYIVENGKAVPREISFIDWPGEAVVVESGLAAGDLVILDSLRVAPGVAVKSTGQPDQKVR